MTHDLVFHVPRFAIRPLPHPELRQDPIIDRWVVISTDRLGRPQEYAEESPTPGLGACPFCAGNEQLTPTATHVETDAEGRWRVRVVPNTFPAVRGEGEWSAADADLLRRGPALGMHEVIIACPRHEAKLNRLSADHVAALFRSFRARLRALRTSPAIPIIFNNHRAAAGASLEHAHAQLITLPTLPELLAREAEAGHQYQRHTGRCKWCDLLERELADGSRIIFQTPRFVVLASYAARFPCEVWIVPKAHAGDFAQSSDPDLTDLGAAFRQVLSMLDRGLDDPPYNSYLHSLPTARIANESFHWHLEILPRLTGTAGFEWGTGMAINPVPPEQAAAYLRDVG